MRLTASLSEVPLASLIITKYIKSSKKVDVQWSQETNLVFDEIVFNSDFSICRYLARLFPNYKLYGASTFQYIEVDHWLSFAIGPIENTQKFQKNISYLDKQLQTVTYLVGEALTIADIFVWSVLFGNQLLSKVEAEKFVNIHRWFSFIESHECVKECFDSLPADIKRNMEQLANKNPTGGASSERKEEGKFIELPGAEMGKVVVRFPPEASGYLHIGHAKAALLNQYYQDKFEGKLIMRFDDTNPAKEKVNFEKVILEDLELLKIKPDIFTHTSDYFDKMLEFCEQLLREGKAYVDDTDPEIMKQEREQRADSKNRNNSVEQNFVMWQEMQKGTEYGQKCCVRAKIDMSSDNGCLRDPTIYRCKNETHPKTGNKYKVYPTYDFACPIVDSIEGVTHCLRTTEYHDRDDQFYWFIDALKLRKPYIWEYSRLNMTNTVLSKRKLTWFVEEGYVDGWDDARFPTVRGILRHGMTVAGLKQFIIAQGSSRSVVSMEWDKIWSFNKKVIDPIAPRYNALESQGTVPVLVKNVKTEKLQVSKHPKNEEVGKKFIWKHNRILIDNIDAEELKENENTTFINWGNLMIKKVNKDGQKITSIEAEENLSNTDFKKTLKLTWLADIEEAPFVPCVCVYFDHIISKPVLGKDEDFKQYINPNTRIERTMLGDPELITVKKGDIIQFQRRGFYICDQEYEPRSVYTGCETPIVLFFVPDGHSKENPITAISKKEAARQETKSNKTKVLDKKKKDVGKVSGIIASADVGIAQEAAKLLDSIKAQGDRVRQLKAEKTEKSVVEDEVGTLLQLKKSFKALTNQEWKPGVTLEQLGFSEVPVAAEIPSSASNNSEEVVRILDSIKKQGDRIRALKSEKKEKKLIDKQVEILKQLKKTFTDVTKQEWKPGITLDQVIPPSTNTSKDTQPIKPTAPPAESVFESEEELYHKVCFQSGKIRHMQACKVDKNRINTEVTALADLKEKYRVATSKQWSQKPGADINEYYNQYIQTIYNKVTEQGNKIRQLKANKATKDVIDAEVKTLKDLKADYKEASGSDYQPPDNKPVSQPSKPANVSTGPSGAVKMDSGPVQDIHEKIVEQGNKVRTLKAEHQPKDVIMKEVEVLKQLKDQFEKAAGIKWTPGINLNAVSTDNPAPAPAKPAPSEKKKAPAKQPEPKKPAPDSAATGLKKQTRLGLEASKEENLAEWYTQVITKGELIEYYDVSGCYTLRPWAFAVWKEIRAWFDEQITSLGVDECYFPIFVSKHVLEKEKTHIADFAPEVAWVTKSGDSDLEEPIAIRPTSETVMYPAYSKWIRSHRDLPMRLNQWNNVVRWEFKHPQPFLRTREFLWQEGHTAFASQKEAEEEVFTILDLYSKVYTELLAVPVIKGKKTNKEKFAGSDFSTTVEAFISASGRGIQGGTSHHLGQNFSKMFEIVYEDPETQEKKFVYQNSWGLTTRTIGVMIMVHGDNKGLVLPPRVAKIQVVIVPCGISSSLKPEEREALEKSCTDLEKILRLSGIKVFCDLRDNYSSGWKFNHWELKGVPMRIELGPKDMKQNQLIAVRRDTGEKVPLKRDLVEIHIKKLLEEIQQSLYQKAEADLKSHTIICENWPKFVQKLNEKNVILSPFCGEVDCEDKIKEDSAKGDSAEPGALTSGAKSLCIPFDQPKSINPSTKCINPSCTNRPLNYTLFGRSY